MPRLLTHKRRATYHPPRGGANETKNSAKNLTSTVSLVVSFHAFSAEKGAARPSKSAKARAQFEARRSRSATFIAARTTKRRSNDGDEPIVGGTD
jgi:hypothetical protein